MSFVRVSLCVLVVAACSSDGHGSSGRDEDSDAVLHGSACAKGAARPTDRVDLITEGVHVRAEKSGADVVLLNAPLGSGGVSLQIDPICTDPPAGWTPVSDAYRVKFLDYTKPAQGGFCADLELPRITGYTGPVRRMVRLPGNPEWMVSDVPRDLLTVIEPRTTPAAEPTVCGDENNASSDIIEVEFCPPEFAFCANTCKDLGIDHEHCGACDSPCDAAHVCSGSTCSGIVLTPPSGTVIGDAVPFDGKLYATAAVSDSPTQATQLIAIDPQTGAIETLVTRTDTSIWGIAVDDGFVYWSAREMNQGPGAIFRRPLASDDISEIAGTQSAGTAEDPYGPYAPIAVRDGFVYWINAGEKLLQRAPVEGADRPMMLDACDGAYSLDLVVTSDSAYVQCGRELRRIELASGTRSVLDAGAEYPRVAIEGDTAYYAKDFTIVSLPIDGGSPSVIVSDVNVVALTVLGGRIDYVDHDGMLWQVPVAGGTPSTVATGVERIALFELARAGDALYYRQAGAPGVVYIPTQTKPPAH